MNTIIDTLTAMAAVASLPLFILGIRKLFRQNMEDLQKRRVERRCEEEMKESHRSKERKYTNEATLAHAHDSD